VKCKSSRQLIKCLSASLAAGAFAAPVAQAHHAPAEYWSASVPRASIWLASSFEIDRLGPKHVTLHHPYSAAPVEASTPGPTAAGTAIANARHDAMPVSVVKVVRSSGFNWGDAGIGAGVASLTLALVAMLALLVTRRSRGASVPEPSELAGT
jgi:hypothetical protein